MNQQKDFEGLHPRNGSEWQKTVVAGHVQAALDSYMEKPSSLWFDGYIAANP